MKLGGHFVREARVLASETFAKKYVNADGAFADSGA